jgi:hypothetical protein
MSKGILLATFLSAVTATFWCVGVCRSDDSKTTEVGVADLLKLPDEDDYKVDPYLRAAQSLQAMGEEKACKLLADLAVKQTRSETRTVTLCRMLFKAKSGGAFRRPLLGGPCFLAGGADANDWPLEPITIVDGVPFRVVRGYRLAGEAESSASYLVYCLTECEWNDFKFKPKSLKEKKKALESLLMSPKLKGKLKDGDKDFLEAQIK